MFLKKLYSEPLGLFEPVEFKNGINFIFGKKGSKDKKKSLNGIGKSLSLDFIDFCLLSSLTPRLRLAREKKILDGFKIVLEFVVNDKPYSIKRSIETPNQEIEFCEASKCKLYKESEISELLCDLIFKDSKYSGFYSNKCLRHLLSFFIKIQPPKKDRFTDPIQYMYGPKVMELMQYHFLFMGINNTLLHKNFILQVELKERKPIIIGIERFIKETYGFRNIGDATNEIDRILLEIKQLESLVQDFKLVGQYDNAEREVNDLTAKIKDLWYQNFNDRKKIESYSDSFKLDETVNTKKIERIYQDLNALLAQKIKKTLDEAIIFRKQLSESRKEFLFKEIEGLKKVIERKETEINALEIERARLFGFLSNKEAIRDLSEAYLLLSKKREKLNHLEGKLGLYTDFQKEKAELKKEEAELYSEILQFLDKIKGQVSEFRKVFSEIYNAIYTDVINQSVFAINPKEKTDAKIEIRISFPSDLSKGKNQGRTLIYDLAMLFHAIEMGIKVPRFLIHDGIFDGMDKAHFVHLYEYLESKAKVSKFQYIVTMNEEGTLNENFGSSEKVTPEKIAEEAIICLTSDKKFVGKNF
jgi:uncharacterized protein YydD (DUF2326 family)